MVMSEFSDAFLDRITGLPGIADGCFIRCILFILSQDSGAAESVEAEALPQSDEARLGLDSIEEAVALDPAEPHITFFARLLQPLEGVVEPVESQVQHCEEIGADVHVAGKFVQFGQCFGGHFPLAHGRVRVTFPREAPGVEGWRRLDF